MQLLDIAEGFEDDEIHAAFEQGCDLFAESVFGFLEGSFAQRLNPDSEGADGTCDPSVKALGSFFGELGAGKVNVMHLAT